MEAKPRPTRAEVSDITNAIFDMTDANMTSGETTNGQFPTECAQILKKVLQRLLRLLKRLKVLSTTREYLRIEKTSSMTLKLSVQFP